MNADDRKRCIAEVCWIATRQGAFQRSYVYDKSASSKEREKAREGIRYYLASNLLNKVNKQKVSETLLISLIEGLISELQSGHKNVLDSGRFQWGNAQKFVNLYLKNLWLMGVLVGVPPHFPVDGIMIKKLGLNNQGYKWTDMNRKQYNEVIEAARKIAKPSLAEWEAIEWLKAMNNRRKTKLN